ncbi:MAG: hypothetical protein ABIF87_03670 [Pseudomonadota bacterium]
MSADIIKETENDITIKCAFCNGKGTDPFELLSEISVCQVCGNRKEVKIHKPAIACAYCGGTGIQPGRRLTCQVCGAKGMVSINEPIEKCSDCNGKGVCAGAYLPCLTCGGTGVLTVSRSQLVGMQSSLVKWSSR